MVDAAASVLRALAAVGTEYRQSGCLEAVYAWCGSPNTKQPKGRYLTAIASYRETVKAVGQLRTDWRNAPAGAIHYWDGNPGHVALGTGRGMAVTTNAPQRVSSTRGGTRYARVGEQSVERIGQGRGRYLGWAMWAFDQHVTTPTAPAGGTTKPIGDDDMTPEQDRKLTALYDLWAPGVAGRHHDGPGWTSIKDIAWRVRNLWDELLLGSEGVKRDGSVAERVKWAWQNSDKLVKALGQPQAPAQAVTLDVTPEQLATALTRPEVAQALATALLDATKQRL